MRHTLALLGLVLALAGCALETGPVDPAFVRGPGTPGGVCYTGCER